MITLKGVTLRRGTKVLLEGATVALNPGEKIGLVGRNGAGKSSLFALLSGALHEDAGEFLIPPTWRMAQVAQEMPETGESATDFVIAGDTRLMAAQAEVHAAEAAGDGERMGHAYAALHDAGAAFDLILADTSPAKPAARRGVRRRRPPAFPRDGRGSACRPRTGNRRCRACRRRQRPFRRCFFFSSRRRHTR